MEKGLLHKKIFNLKSPTLEKEKDLFESELKERMEKYKVTKFIGLHKYIDTDRLEICVIPCTDTPGGKPANLDELMQQGYVVNEQIDISTGPIKKFDFSSTVSFEMPKKKKAD